MSEKPGIFKPFLEDTDAKVRVIVPVLNVRSGPGTNYPIVDRLQLGTIVDISDIVGSTIWAMLPNGNWIALQYLGKKFAELTKGD